MRVLGIDPGSNITGFGIIEKSRKGLVGIRYGEIKAGRNQALSSRLFKIYTQLSEIMITESPDAVALEEIFFGKNVQSLIKQGHARGIAILAAAQQGVPVYEYSPLEIKKAVVGYGFAEKGQVQKMVKLILGLTGDPPLDASDALAIAICHSNFLKEIAT